MNREEIKQILAHREPFLFIDEVTVLQPGKYAAGNMLVKPNEPYLEDNLTENGKEQVFPASLLLEAMAQLGAIAVLSMPECRGKISVLVGIDHASIYDRAVLGEKVWLEAEILQMRGKIGKRKCLARVNDRLIAEAEILYSLASIKGSKS
jgi:3-hydroxyacyl-[acyl-carrier-protein] dehydratase